MPEFKLLSRIYPDKKNLIKREILKQSIICFKEIGVKNTTMRDISMQSKYSLRTIYNHVKSKEEIIFQLFQAATIDLYRYRMNYLLDAFNFKECIYALVLSYLDWIDEHPYFSKILLSEVFSLNSGKNSEKIKKIRNKYQTKIYKWITLPENKPKFELEIPEELYPSIINGIPEHYAKYWHLNHVKQSPKKYKKVIASVVWDTIHTYNKSKIG